MLREEFEGFSAAVASIRQRVQDRLSGRALLGDLESGVSQVAYTQETACKVSNQFEKSGEAHYDQSSDCHISSVQHPEHPRCQPAVAFLSSQRQYLLLKKLLQNRPLLALIYPRYCNCKLEVFKLVQDDIDSVPETIRQ